jgi:hypothetical protein
MVKKLLGFSFLVVTFKAPTVKIQGGFHAEEDATVRIKQE